MSDKADRRAMLVADLRSGEYTQHQSYLRKVDYGTQEILGHCCLGVACDRYARETGNGHWDDERFVVGDVRDSAILPAVVKEWYGFYGSSGELVQDARDREDSLYSLVDLNDSGGKPFDDIADVIERGDVRVVD